MFDKGLFGGLFDFNGDGKMDSFEKSAEFSSLMRIISESEKSTARNTNDSSDGCDYSLGDTSEIEDALDDAGIDMSDFELMDDDERAEVLSDAGYDIDDFDY